VIGFAVVLALASAGIVQNDAWLVIGPAGGAIIGTILVNVLPWAFRSRPWAKLGAESGLKLETDYGSLTIKRVPMTSSESALVWRREKRALIAVPIVFFVAAGLALIGQIALALALVIIGVLWAIFPIWTWLETRDRTTVWAEGMLGLTSRIEKTRYSSRTVYSVSAGSSRFDIELYVYERMRRLGTKSESYDIYSVAGAVQFLPGTMQLLRVQAPAGKTVYYNPGLPEEAESPV